MYYLWLKVVLSIFASSLMVVVSCNKWGRNLSDLMALVGLLLEELIMVIGRHRGLFVCRKRGFRTRKEEGLKVMLGQQLDCSFKRTSWHSSTQSSWLQRWAQSDCPLERATSLPNQLWDRTYVRSSRHLAARAGRLSVCSSSSAPPLGPGQFLGSGNGDF